MNTKFLINPDNRVMMKGAFIKTSKIVDDYIYETEGKALSIDLMKKIAKENGFKVAGKKSNDVQKSFNTGLTTLQISEKNEMSTTEKVEAIVKAGMSDEISEDEILIQIVQSGTKFQRAAKLMQIAMVELGFSVSAKDRYTKCKVIMEDDGFEPEEWPEVETMVATIVEAVKGTTETQAVSQIRKYCKEFEISFPKRHKDKENPLLIQAIAWIIDNAEEGIEAFEEWMDEKEFREKAVDGWKKKFLKVHKQLELNAKSS